MKKRKFGAEIGKVLDLMINALYTNKDIFLRELISNASDACDKLRYLSIQDSNLLNDGEHKFEIIIKIDAKNQTLSIQDNGIGMNEQDMIDNLGTIASSGTQKFLDQISSGQADINLIGQFGVGFYSAFMVAKELTVKSRKAGEELAYQWFSKGNGEFEIGKIEESIPVGTIITLKIKSKETKYLDKFHLKHIISTYSDHISFPIKLAEISSEDDINVSNNDISNKSNHEDEIINKVSALWTQPKNKISEDQYNEFYRYISHQPDKPWMKIHVKVEGNIEYSSLLFIPSMRPFDLTHPDRETRVKLYIKKVFITDDTVKILPRHLRFLRGVIDSEDLPLNISRETIQHSKIIDKIGKSLTKKIMEELKNEAIQNPENYEKFWFNFGEVLKEGLCEHMYGEKESILELCKFNSSKLDKLISLDEYIANMIQNQKKIYYITGDSTEKLKSNPSLEGFDERGIEVLLLSDHVDDFWINVINKYKDFELANISTANINLDEIANIENIADNDSEDDTTLDNIEKITSFFKEILHDTVQKVNTTSKLINSPACIAIPEGYMSSKMERMMIEQKQLKSAAAKILEINPKHFLVRKIKEMLDKEVKDKAAELVWLVYDQACILEGEKINNPQASITRINKLLSKIELMD